MMPKVPMTDDEIRMHKPVSPDFVDFRAGIRCAERVYEVETLYKRIAGYELLVQSMEAELEAAKADAQKWRDYKARKDAVIAAGMGRNPLRNEATK